MLGRYLLWKFIEDDRVRAIEHFNRAIELQPDYASPYAALAHAWWMRGVFGPLSLREVATPAREAAMAALARDDGNVEAHAALAYVQGMFDWDWSRAQATIQRAVTLEPNERRCAVRAQPAPDGAGAPRRGSVRDRLRRTGGPVIRSGALDIRSGPLPRTPVRGGSRSPGAVSRARAAEYDDVRSTRGGAGAIGALRQGARRWWTRCEALSGGSTTPFSWLRARILARAGRTTEARRLLAQVPPQSPQRAEVLAALADHDAAFTSLFRALEERESWLLFIKSDPIFEPLHGDPRWTAVLRRMNLD